MNETTAANDIHANWEPICPICGKPGYGWHDGNTTTPGHYFDPPFSQYVKWEPTESEKEE